MASDTPQTKNHNLHFTPDNEEHDDPVCIVGMACHLPGAIRSHTDLWDFLVHKKSAQGVVPPNRFNIQGFHDKGHDRAGILSGNGGYFLADDPREFDSSFFGINNVEATYMDPQQRKLLEVVFECFENAGVPLSRMSGSNTGVYVGNFTHDHYVAQLRDPDDIHRYHASGIGATMLANRISHAFNLHGPSITLDTACSSTMYSLHIASMALKAGECDGAIVAGTNLIMSPQTQIATAKAGILSPASACRTFDTLADGYGRAEGVNAVYLKRLSTAVRDMDNIYAIVRGTAVNANGHTPGITLPSADQQEAVIKTAYERAGLDFADTDYVECHGTGTAVGDRVEIEALGRCIGSRSNPLMVGSVKTNLGHSEAASGLTSVIKVALALQRGLIPPTQGVKTLNPKLKLGELNIRVVTEVEYWPKTCRRASINSFGYGGANAHAILESPESYLGTTSIGEFLSSRQECHPRKQPLVLLPVSAKSAGSLNSRVAQVSQIARRSDPITLEKLAHTLTGRRSHMEARSFILAKSLEDGTTWLSESKQAKYSGPLHHVPIAFIFTGQGAQYAGMAKGLLQHKICLSTFRYLDDVLRSLPPHHVPKWTIEGTIRDSSKTSDINDAALSQPLCTAIQIALIDLLSSWGINATNVIGHSSGEIAAAYAAGIHSAAEAILVAYFRGIAVKGLQAKGAMMAVEIGHENLKQPMAGVEVACFNSPSNITLSGSPTSIMDIRDELESLQIFCRILETGGRAYHSFMMKEAGERYQLLITPYLGNSKYSEPRRHASKMHSSVWYNGDRPAILDSSTDMAQYWRDNLEKPVQFNGALSKLISGHKFHLIEIGPHPALKSSIQQIKISAGYSVDDLPYSSTLQRKQDAHTSVMTLAGTLFLHHHELNWEKVNDISPGGLVPNIPPYPWDYSKGLFWYESRSSIEMRNRKYARHELLGSQRGSGNGIDWSWRNIIRLDEIPWVRDHKVENQVVFPAAGYLAMAIEAVCQIRNLRDRSEYQKAHFNFTNVSINAALVLQDMNERGSQITELHTMMSLRKLSTRSVSSNIFDFHISSWTAGRTVVHCAGSISIKQSQLRKGTVRVQDTSGYRAWSMYRWYSQCREEGLNLGPHFQTISNMHNDGSRERSDIICTTHPTVGNTSTSGYLVHPLVIDACLQALMLSATHGTLSMLRPYLPTFIPECRIEPSSSSIMSETPNKTHTIHARSQKTGFSTLRATCTLWDDNDSPKIEIKEARLSMYVGKVTRNDTVSDQHQQRHPVLRVKWKPDVLQLDTSTEKAFDQYISKSIKHGRIGIDEVTSIMHSIIDLMGHKNPRMNVLEVGQDSIHDATLSNLLGKGTTFPRYRSWNSTTLNDFRKSSHAEGLYDLLILKEQEDLVKSWEEISGKLLPLCGRSGVLIMPKVDHIMLSLREAGFEILVVRERVILATQVLQKSLQNRKVLIVTRLPSPIIDQFTTLLKEYLHQCRDATQVEAITFSQLRSTEISSNDICISLLEIEEEFLATMSQEDMDLLRRITDTSTDILWVTGANMLGTQPDPDLTLSRGLGRTLMAEQPSLRFTIVDVGSCKSEPSNIASACEKIGKVLLPSHVLEDHEFIYVQGLLYVSRFSPDDELNTSFQARSRTAKSFQKIQLANTLPAKLVIRNIGQPDTIFFQQHQEPVPPLPAGFIDIAVKAVSLNASSLGVLSGRNETSQGTMAAGFSGVVTAVGLDVELRPGDRIMVNAANHFSTTERIPAWKAHKLLPHESLTDMTAIPAAYSTALYAIHTRANLQPGETILIHSGTDAFGLAAISLARLIGAVVYTTANSKAKREFLSNELGVPTTNILPQDNSLFDAIMEATDSKGVDVVVNSLPGELLYTTWSCIADFGRFVEVGKRETLNAGKLEMSVFSRNATFTAFDPDELFSQSGPNHRGLYMQLTREAIELHRLGKVKLMPSTVFDVADTTKAFQYLSSPNNIGQVIVSLEDPMTYITAAPPKFETVFDANKAYLLIGCLGGLGRSLSSWMLTRGARNFVFLGRSGCDRTSSMELVNRLKARGAQVHVIRGDVTDIADVKKVVAVCSGTPIGGVVHAAMGLHEDIFTRMTNEAWRTSVRPKWAGAWNLHRALEGHDEALDFFLTTSSITGSLGVATESNYCAANAFLDAFAYWRQTQGKPSISIGLGMISEVGYLHEHPHIESLLLRRGIQPINEDEFLQIIDLALSAGKVKIKPPISGYLGAAHMLTGMELSGVRNLLNRGYDVTHTGMEDMRSSILSAALDSQRESQRADEAGLANPLRMVTNVPWLKALPLNAANTLAIETSAPSLLDAISRLVIKRFSSLILVPVDQIDASKPFASYGVDSMIASEYRAWFWNAFKVEVPFLDLLSPQKGLGTVSAFIATLLTKDGAD
ncbi:hypothetical protein M426DRAFT_14612 [Hypoxylon sp. CI-4A]|nr:hypothetical protein M426DRAFT_14612 [Hypoxylon sp. CI-4A]